MSNQVIFYEHIWEKHIPKDYSKSFWAIIELWRKVMKNGDTKIIFLIYRELI